MDLKAPKEVELVEFSVSSEVGGESWLELGGLRERSQRQKATYCMIPFI